MGTPVPPIDPIPGGPLCSICWGIGKAFGIGPTPSVVQIVVADVEKGPLWIPADGEPINGTFFLDQNSSVPCNFHLENDEVLIDLFFETLDTTGRVNGIGFPFSFFGTIILPCQIVIPNNLTQHFKNGTMTVFIITE